jgi:hypothetical protein
MSDLEALGRDIAALKELLRISWRDLASKELTSFERRETRNQMARAAIDLRHHLQAFEAEYNRLRKLSAEHQVKRGLRSVQLRFLSADYDLTKT